MTRLQRNRLKRRRKRHFILGISLCVFILIGGIIITNDIMIKMTALPKEKNLFHIDNIIKKVDHIVDTIVDSGIWVRDNIAWFYDIIVQWIGRFK